MSGGLDAAVSEYVGLLWQGTWQGGLFIAAVWVICSLAPRMPAHWRCWLWWAACLRLLLGLLALPVLPVPLLPAAPPSYVAPASLAADTDPGHQSEAAMHESSPTAPNILHAVLGVWITGALLRLGAGMRTFRRVRRLRKSARPVEVAVVREAAARLSADAGLRWAPLTLISSAAKAPMLVGPFAPALLLPEEALEIYSPDELRMALAHEIVHLRRGDLWLSVIPGLTQVLFFFHPLAWLAAREWELARETACDAEAVRLTASRPADYARFLLRLAGSGAAPAGALNATPTYRTFERRLKMLRDTASSGPWSARSRQGKLAGMLLVAIVAGGFLPWQVTAKEAAAPVVSGARASAPADEAPSPAVKPELMPANDEAAARADLERLAKLRLQELLQKRDREQAMRLKTLEREAAHASRAQRERLLKQLEVQDRRDMAAALHRFETELKAAVRNSIDKGADPRTAQRTLALSRHLVKDLILRTVESQRKNRRLLLDSLEGNILPTLDPTTGVLRAPKGAAAIRGRLPAPSVSTLSEVSIRGNTAISLETLLKVVKTRAGEAFNRARWEEDQVAISRLYQDQGFQIRMETEGPKSGKLELVIQELTVGEVRFKWRTPESEKHAKAASEPLVLKTGGLYNMKELQKDFLTLRTLGLFKTINPVVEVDDTGKIVIVWELEAEK